MPNLSLFLTYFSLIILLLQAVPEAKGANSQDITVTLPAATVLSSLQQAVPMELHTDNSNFDGTISVQSVNSLSIKDDIIFIEGIIKGHDLSLITKIADQNIRLKLGQVTLPVSCALQTRFDKTNNDLYVRPTFKSQGNNSLTPLFNALQKKE